MQDDNIMPNDGTYFMPREPEEQVVERKKERAQTLESINVLKDVLQRLDERIAFYNSMDSITDDAKTNAEEFMHLYSAYKLTRDCLISEKEWIADLLDTNAKNL